MQSEDGSIIYECLNGESEAFGVLVDKYKAGIYAFTYGKLGNFQDAQDVTQEVFEHAYRGLRNLRQWERFAFWLYRIASNQCKKWLRAQSRRPDSDFSEDQDPMVLEAPSLDSYSAGQMDESLRESLDSLPEIYREVLMLHYFGGMTSKDIAGAIGISPTAVRMRLTRARIRLREEMVAMMDTNFEGQGLQANFTFSIVEMIKRIKINPTPRATGLPWGLLLATGIIVVAISLSSHISMSNPISIPTGSQLPGKTAVLKTGEISVDIMDYAQISVIASRQGDNNDGITRLSVLQKAVSMAPAIVGDTWTEKADMPGARMCSTAEVNGKIYAIGGTFDDVIPFNKVEEYDPAVDKWTRKASMPTARSAVAIGVVNGKIYVIGGWKAGWIGCSTVEAYDPVADKWTRKADMPTARWCSSGSVVNDKIYVIGGWTGGGGQVLSTVEEYDPLKDEWTKKADMPTARDRFSTSVVNGKIYAIGGTDRINQSFSIVEEYDPVTDLWTRKADMPTARGALSTSVVNEKIYAIGGAPNVNATLSTVEMYDPASDKWTKKLDMPTARAFVSTSAVDGKIYAIGGLLTWKQILSVVHEYIPGEQAPDESFSIISPQGKAATSWGNLKSK